MMNNIHILFNVGAALLLLTGALVLATPESASACEIIRCFEVCWVNAGGGSGCDPNIQCVCF